MERLEATVSGRVQLVMYRDFVQRTASSLGLIGEVQNLRDGTVRVVAEGPRVALEKLLVRLHQGSLLAHVTKVVPTWVAASGAFTRFSIRYE